MQRQPGVPPADDRAGLPDPGRCQPTSPALPAPLVRGGTAGPLVPRGRRPAGPALPAAHPPGPPRPPLPPHLPAHPPTTARRGQPPLRDVRRAGVDTGTEMTGSRPLGPLIHSFFINHLITVKGLRPASVH